MLDDKEQRERTGNVVKEQKISWLFFFFKQSDILSHLWIMSKVHTMQNKMNTYIYIYMYFFIILDTKQHRITSHTGVPRWWN